MKQLGVLTVMFLLVATSAFANVDTFLTDLENFESNLNILNDDFVTIETNLDVLEHDIKTIPTPFCAPQLWSFWPDYLILRQDLQDASETLDDLSDDLDDLEDMFDDMGSDFEDEGYDPDDIEDTLADLETQLENLVAYSTELQETNQELGLIFHMHRVHCSI